jgi:hypothetical protein
MAWREIARSDLSGWNRRLLQESSASLRQFPLLNEGLRGSGRLGVSIPGRFSSLIAKARQWTTSPRYIVHDSPQGESAFACIVTIGLPGFRVGCILDGPVPLGGRTIDASVMSDLMAWARRNHYIALRVTHSSEALLASLSGMGKSERVDGVPFYPHPDSELYVDISVGEAAILSRFQKIARQEIRYATEAGYVVSIDHDPQALEKAWPAFQSRSTQKGISYRDLETYRRMMLEAEPLQSANLFTAWRDKTPIAAALILRDPTTAHYFLGTVDVEALGDSPSPACLLQWSAMRHAAERGASFYNLGTRSGSVQNFKAKFRPVENEWPAPVTFAINESVYNLWRRMLPSLSRAVT